MSGYEGIIAIAVTLFGMQAAFGSWISNQFSKMSSKMDKLRDDILDKVEYHERHDDRRFSDLGDDVWEIKLRLSTLDAKRTDHWPERKQKKSIRSPQSEINGDS